jgi:hypothetical protein
MAPARKYGPLNRYLEALPAEQQSVTLTFAALEALLGGPLPATAQQTTFWARGSMARRNWQFSGFTALLDRVRHRVIFTRRRTAAHIPATRPR